MSIPALIRKCRACRAELAAGARFCAACGARVTASPPAITWDVAERRYFGVLPGRRFFRAARLRLARFWAIMVARVRLLQGTLSSGFREQVETLKLRREATAAWRDREQALRELGDAVYREVQEETETARGRAAAADARLAHVEEKLHRLREETRRTVRRAWREEGPTVIEPAPVEPPPVEPPGPVIVPEPEPVPHEPPGPIIVPEPEPVPHEPPGPVIVPEPQPPQAR